MRGHIPLHSFIIRRGIIDQLAVLGKARAVAGTIPGVLGYIVFESATEVWTSGCGRCEKSDSRLKSVDDKLWAHDGARGIENGGMGIIFPSDEVAEDVGCDHGVGHPPFVKSRCNEYIGRGF